jgi:FKBP-type peptidyl-prolyl cis-trans isomerase FkpA
MSCAAPLRLLPALAVTLLLVLAAQTQAQSAAPKPGAASAGASTSASSSAAADPLSPAARAKASYVIGLEFGAQIKNAGLSDKTLSFTDLEKGVRAAFGGKEVTREEAEALQSYFIAARQAQVDANHDKAKTFLAFNAKKPGVKTTATGLQYKVLAPGSGESQKRTDTVTVNYIGKLTDGTEFDGTDRHGGQPSSFPVGGVIPGFTEALLLMKPGAKYQIFIPPELAYDTRVPPGAAIPPGAALIFDLELLKIQPPTPAPAPVVPPGHPAVPPAH